MRSLSLTAANPVRKYLAGKYLTAGGRGLTFKHSFQKTSAQKFRTLCASRPNRKFIHFLRSSSRHAGIHLKSRALVDTRSDCFNVT